MSATDIYERRNNAALALVEAQIEVGGHRADQILTMFDKV